MLYTLFGASSSENFLQISVSSVVQYTTSYLFQAITKLLLCSPIRINYVFFSPFFPGRKRFVVPRDVEPSAPPTPIHIFPARSAVPSPAEVQQPVVADGDQNGPVSTCEFCLRSPCITQSEFKPVGRGEARITNHTKRRKDYKWFWRTLKDCGLWENPTYLARKQELGCMIDDVREVMPLCVVKDVRERWPNPPNVPYQGHRRS